MTTTWDVLETFFCRKKSFSKKGATELGMLKRLCTRMLNTERSSINDFTQFWTFICSMALVDLLNLKPIFTTTLAASKNYT